MWDLPGSGIKLMFPALAGGFLTKSRASWIPLGFRNMIEVAMLKVQTGFLPWGICTLTPHFLFGKRWTILSQECARKTAPGSGSLRWVSGWHNHFCLTCSMGWEGGGEVTVQFSILDSLQGRENIKWQKRPSLTEGEPERKKNGYGWIIISIFFFVEV